MKMTAGQVLAERRRLLKELQPEKKKKSKYNATQITKGEIRFDSKLEAAYYEYVLELQKQNVLKFHLRQVPFHLPGKIKYLVDFVLFYPDGTVRFIDIKGIMTPVSLNKIKQVVDIFPVRIEILTKVELKELNIRI